ncbi:kinase [Nonomuraea sp. NPDC050202]|uniref:kinase n=1 Tax=Nonomuraea sp. NPDC050202 TaxID=3155035 RepID=UPI0033F33D4B
MDVVPVAVQPLLHGWIGYVANTKANSATLVILRGNSASGKTTIAKAVQARLGRGVVARIGQDQLRRDILKEWDVPGGIAPDFICHMASYLLDKMPVVLVEGIMASARYKAALQRLIDQHPGRALVYWLDVEFAETLHRHATRPQAAEFTPEDMAGWYVQDDWLGLPGEALIPQESSLEETIQRICRDIGSPVLEDGRMPPACGTASDATSGVDRPHLVR